MYAFATIAFALAATAVALPQDGGAPEGGAPEGKGSKGSSVTVEQAQNQCNGGNAQQVSCCTSESTDGVLSVLDDLSIAGGQCSQVNIPIAVLGTVQSDPVQEFCSGNQVACCPAGTSGASSGCTAV